MALEVVKMRQGMSYSCKEKTIILNVFKYFRTMHPDKCVTEIVRRTAKATGCSEKSVFQFRKEEASGEGFKEPSKTKIRKNININSRFMKYDESVRQAIRNLIYDLKYRNIVPTLSTLLKNINANEKLPNFSIMTLRRLLRDMGFYYEKEKVGSKAVLVEKTDHSSDLKKENLPYNKKIQVHHSVPHHGVPHSNHVNISSQSQKQVEVKAYPLPIPQNNTNVDSHQMYISNHGHRPFPIALSHQENVGLDPRFVTSNIMPHQLHGLPPPNIKPPDMNYIHPSHPHTMALQH
ncbi:uncharacterized protein LOC108911295 [Anoplophora glabripennis]|uniref:uncharacterized protein LOC108911295 n=1 Tax=Anoplophora glabripennis TaxID=217634 RepID=UPI0008740F82|nr:uncharacterized protein LOC108911295 [Anoplophora glabripennis]